MNSYQHSAIPFQVISIHNYDWEITSRKMKTSKNNRSTLNFRASFYYQLKTALDKCMRSSVEKIVKFLIMVNIFFFLGQRKYWKGNLTSKQAINSNGTKSWTANVMWCWGLLAHLLICFCLSIIFGFSIINHVVFHLNLSCFFFRWLLNLE